MKNKIIDLLTKSISEITGIIDFETLANANYVEEKIISVLKDLALAVFPANTFYLTDRELGEPFFNSLDELINKKGEDFLIVNILKQLEKDKMIIEDELHDVFFITQNVNSEIYIKNNLNTVYFKNIILNIEEDGLNFNNCFFDNCLFKKDGILSNLYLEDCLINNCTFNLENISLSLKNCKGFNNRYNNLNEVENDGGEMLLNIFNNCSNINFETNLLNELNIIME